MHPTLKNNFPLFRPSVHPCVPIFTVHLSVFVRSSRFRPTRLCAFVHLSVCHVFDPPSYVSHCAPQTILEKLGELKKNSGILDMRVCSSNSLFKVKTNALSTQGISYIMWLSLWFCKLVDLKRLPQNIHFLKVWKTLFIFRFEI